MIEFHVWLAKFTLFICYLRFELDNEYSGTPEKEEEFTIYTFGFHYAIPLPHIL